MSEAEKQRKRAAKAAEKARQEAMDKFRSKHGLLSDANIERLQGQASAAGKKGGEARRAKINEDDYVAGYRRAQKAVQRAAKNSPEWVAAAEQMRAYQGMLNDLGLNVKGEPKQKPGRKPAAQANSGTVAGACGRCQAKSGEAHRNWCPNR